MQFVSSPYFLPATASSKPTPWLSCAHQFIVRGLAPNKASIIDPHKPDNLGPKDLAVHYG